MSAGVVVVFSSLSLCVNVILYSVFSLSLSSRALMAAEEEEDQPKAEKKRKSSVFSKLGSYRQKNKVWRVHAQAHAHTHTHSHAHTRTSFVNRVTKTHGFG